ncbi:MAG: hypothetical protein GKR93_14490 [Gammaproteobacteria bacterium]|nr:hypothetical protein [Gammaproteobacteria bacterium]
MTDRFSVPSILEAFNARNLSPIEVAETFICSEHFEELVSRNNSLIVGPRGSGKTTLLKMLQPTALCSWKQKISESYRQKIDYPSVFILADSSWGSQLSSIGKRRIPKIWADKLGYAAFTSHVLRSLLYSMHECSNGISVVKEKMPHIYSKIDRDLERNIVKNLSESWLLNTTLYTFSSLQLSIEARLNEIGILINRWERYTEDQIKDDLNTKLYLDLDFLSAITFGVHCFNSFTNRSEMRWAFLFDELEIAPEIIRKKLFNALRNSDDKLIFKLSITPYTADMNLLDKVFGPNDKNDYSIIRLWLSTKSGNYDFSKELIKSFLQRNQLPFDDLAKVFGVSVFDEGRNKPDVYKPGKDKPVYNRFKSLFDKDPSFRRYLSSNNINIEKMHTLTDQERASSLRKISSIVAVRNNYLKVQKSENARIETARAGRKTSSLYSGLGSILSITEGNPRWIIGFMTPLVRELKSRDKNKKLSVNFVRQAKEITTLASRFRALLKTVPYEKEKGVSDPKGLLGLLDKIGEYYFHQVVVNEFQGEPHMSFKLDSYSPIELQESIGRALNVGALVFAPEDSDEFIITSLKGKRLRLSYLLAPYYKLPLLMGRTASLNQILSSQLPLFEQNKND